VNLADRDMFLAAIHAAPDDDAPRLVFTDWLEENGEEERAEFIRIQIAMKQEYEKNQRMTARQDILFLRQKELFQLPWADVARECGAGVMATFSRGFPNYLNLSVSQFVDLGKSFGAWVGPNTKVRLFDGHLKLERIAKLRETTYLRRLSLDGHEENGSLVEKDLTAFLSGPFLENLLEFGFRVDSSKSANYSEDRLIGSIVSASSLTQLRNLDLSAIRISAKGAKLLATAPRLASLRSLNLSRSPLSRNAVKAIANSKYLRGLTRLILDIAEMDEENVARLRAAFPSGVVQTRYGKVIV